MKNQQTYGQWEPIEEGYNEVEVDFAEGVFDAEEEWHDEDFDQQLSGSDGQTLRDLTEEETLESEAYLVEQFGSMEDAEVFVHETYGSASRTMKPGSW